jgi:hypothetical protein
MSSGGDFARFGFDGNVPWTPEQVKSYLSSIVLPSPCGKVSRDETSFGTVVFSDGKVIDFCYVIKDQQRALAQLKNMLGCAKLTGGTVHMSKPAMPKNNSEYYARMIAAAERFGYDASALFDVSKQSD